MTYPRILLLLVTACTLSGCYVGPPGWHRGWHRGYYGGHAGWYDEHNAWRGDWHGGGWRYR
ncbi:hypothetical protein [Tanticharoenia sakaeratensis]|jgi:hypothetical protein|uniref:Lipoprotein n=1 Tax=Tanticharoenia sakaeratensis NBRC 103193 TaxID=1231623 RepID=A0A0D6MH41_9PROT|nr:hypothetical protein [Tanticharoenia sakaeratensis]GAN52942.1 hypothetical protein Tasa_004_007 [Tanticharoenia sakaeratensis NBRC 103193]GBQ19966.1 hypothetical protein AA103193_1218 [Tanticharoenia sakaeratensis NBRC 103193]